jgi:hypothetical protein
VGPKQHKKGKLNMVLKYHEYDDNFLRVANNMGERWWDPMRWRLVTKLLPWGYFLDRHYLTVSPACQIAGTLNIQLHSSEGLNTLTVKCFRRRVWEMRHSGATGWELLSHFRDVCCSSLLQLTRSSYWQQESLFRCQMWPHWMYVLNNIVRKEINFVNGIEN